MRFGPKAALGAAALAGVLALGTSAHAYLTSFPTTGKCLTAKVKTEGKGAGGYISCYGKAASKGADLDPLCLGKASLKITVAFGKLDAKVPSICTIPGDGVARDADTAAFASLLNSLAGSKLGKCDAGKQKLVGKYLAGIAGCYAKAAGAKVPPGVVVNTPLGCTDKLKTKFLAAVAKAEIGLDCSQYLQGAALMAAADGYLDGQTCKLGPDATVCGTTPPGTCGNTLNDPGELCDASAPSAGWAKCGPDFACVDCNCGCPNKVEFTGNASAPESILDTGWTGISHRAPIVSDGTASIYLSGSSFFRPCGTRTVSGPVANGAGQIANQRCTNDTSIHCTGNALCTPGGGTCKFFFGSNLPLAAGGIAVCAVNQFNGAVSGTANVETGDAFTVANLTSRVYNGVSPLNNPCPRCAGVDTKNDGVKAGTCDSGPRSGLTCDGNGAVPNRLDFGTTSLDCPPDPLQLIATLPIDLTNATGPVTKTLSATSPNCGDGSGRKCLCDTCNNLAQQPCTSNADCIAFGATICGGKRCLGGTNPGAACANTSECPGGGTCGRPGAGTRPNGCEDDTSIPGDGTICQNIGGDEGVCPDGPQDGNCSLASGHPQRGCTTPTEVTDCGGAGTCGFANRICFLTGGLSASIGTNTLTATGMADLPVADTSNPTLGSVFCVGPTGLAAVNNVSGLPGPGRTTIKGAAKGHP
jgi:hypothetical protein